MVIVPLSLVRENPTCLFLVAGSLLAILGVPWLAAASLPSRPPLSHGILPVCLCLHKKQHAIPVCGHQNKFGHFAWANAYYNLQFYKTDLHSLITGNC